MELSKIKTIDQESMSFVVNGHRLKGYNKLINKEDFMKQISKGTDLEVMEQHSNMPSIILEKRNYIYIYIYIYINKTKIACENQATGTKKT